MNIENGSKVSWQGVNGIITAVVEERNGRQVVVLPDGHTMNLDAVTGSRTFKIYDAI